MSNKVTAVIFALIITAFIALTVNNAPVKIIHPDALRFMAIFQQEYETVKSVSDVPIAIVHGIKRANEYDYYRGRLTNYAAFGAEALTRSDLPFPFISWLTMAIVILNAAMLSSLVTKNLTSPPIKRILFILVGLILVLNPLFIASYEMQFIYSKYLCVTFMLLFMLAERPSLRGVALIGAIFSDEIGVAFAMIAVFLIVFNKKYKAEQIGNFKLSSLLLPVVQGIAATLIVLLIYFGALQIFFHRIPHFIQHGGFGYYVPWRVQVERSIIYLSDLARVTGGAAAIIITLLILAYRGVGKLRQHQLAQVDQGKNSIRLDFANKRFQEMSVAVFLVLFIVYKMYQGGADIFYYGYPVFMLIMFFTLSLLIKVCSPRLVVGAFSVLALSLATNLPDGFSRMKNAVHKEWLADKTVQLDNFNRIEGAINEFVDRDCSLTFVEINNGQDNNFVGSDYAYSEKYFPILGIIRVLAWPHKLERCDISSVSTSESHLESSH